MSNPTTLLLDEPTNDLDSDSVLWLENFLLSCKLTVLFVSHDEALLSRTATSILLLERSAPQTGSPCDAVSHGI